MRRSSYLTIRYIAGVIILMIGLAACAPGKAGAAAKQTDSGYCVTPSPEGDQTCLNQGKHIGVWNDLRMFDKDNGWASTYRSILHTTDGGQHWTDVTPWQTFSSAGHSATFIDAQTAWVVQQDNRDAKIAAQVFATHDSGSTWQTTTLPDALGSFTPTSSPYKGNTTYASTSSVLARDGQIGWVAVRVLFYPASNPDNVQVEYTHFWQTTDGGNNWAIKLDSLPNTDKSQLMPGGDLWAVSLDANRDFLSDYTSQSILVTQNGGQTWERQTLPQIDQSDLSPGTLHLVAPKFLNNTDGIMVAYALNKQGGYTYQYLITHDSGQSWQVTPSFSAQEYGETDFLDSMHWAFIDKDNTLYQTQDAGQSWNKQQAVSPFQQIKTIDYLSLNQAWAIGYSPTDAKTFQGDSDAISAPMKSDDSGIHWTPIVPYTVG
jgi:photosystem II stability/assembly factor-like uncharacterized protein